MSACDWSAHSTGQAAGQARSRPAAAVAFKPKNERYYSLFAPGMGANYCDE